MRVRQALGTLLSPFSILACSDPVAVGKCDEAARSLDPSLRLPPVTEFQTVDDHWSEIARQVPGGWGGFFLVNGQATIYLAAPGKRDEAVAALYALGVGQPQFDVRSAAVFQGRWDFAQLYDWYRYINDQASTVSGLYFADIDEARNRLHYGVDPGAMGQLESVLQALNLPCDLVIVEATGPPVPL